MIQAHEINKILIDIMRSHDQNDNDAMSKSELEQVTRFLCEKYKQEYFSKSEIDLLCLRLEVKEEEEKPFVVLAFKLYALITHTHSSYFFDFLI